MTDSCIFCSGALDIPSNRRPGRGESCPGCGRDLKCCKQCVYFDEGAYNECREPSAERVVDKEKANFCDYFEFHRTSGAVSEKKESWRDELENLFKK